uniref:Uncharacterized protein n=1 Tax=Fagus sylvatica TaxID=28930 RepID=A0A2N9HL89_FAGSY
MVEGDGSVWWRRLVSEHRGEISKIQSHVRSRLGWGGRRNMPRMFQWWRLLGNEKGVFLFALRFLLDSLGSPPDYVGDWGSCFGVFVYGFVMERYGGMEIGMALMVHRWRVCFVEGDGIPAWVNGDGDCKVEPGFGWGVVGF